eukprot:421189_1
MAFLEISSLPRGEYILGISAFQTNDYPNYGAWKLKVRCGISNYALFRFLSFGSEQNNWFTAESNCENLYGTTLATISTHQDLEEATAIINENGLYTVPVWIGLNKNISNIYQWIDGMQLCVDHDNVSCIDELNWYNDSIPDENYTNVAAYLAYDALGVRPQTYTLVFGGLCNAPNGKYRQIAGCKMCTNCWIGRNVSATPELELDALLFEQTRLYGTTVTTSIIQQRAPVAFWNSTLFIIGNTSIYYSMFELFQNEYKWNQKQYNFNNSYMFMQFQRYAQYQSDLYLYAATNDIRIKSFGEYVLYHINLNTLQIKLYETERIPNVNFKCEGLNCIDNPEDRLTYFCIVATGEYVYVFHGQIIEIFDVKTKSWDIRLMLFISPLTCSITNDHNFIYIFVNPSTQDHSNIIQYNTISGENKYIIAPIVCQFNTDKSYINLMRIPRSITGRNGKIYIHGCHPAIWKTLIFDPTTVMFEINTVGIDAPTSPIHYKNSAMTVFDDNVLLFITYNSTKMSLFYAITDIVSINFTATETIVWPSQGFDIKYYMNDFTDENSVTYNISFQTVDTVVNINQVITLHIIKDNCICNEYNCQRCHQYFDLKNYLSISDNNRDKLVFTANSNSVTELLIIPSNITIYLKRCKIIFDSENKTATNQQASIKFSFELSHECYQRNEAFNLNITAPKVDIVAQMTFYATNATRIIYKVCSLVYDDCMFTYRYPDDNTFHLSFNTNIFYEHSVFQVYIVSNSINLQTIISNFSVQYLYKEPIVYYGFWESVSNIEKTMIILGSIAAFVCMIIIFVWQCKKIKDEKQRRKQHEYKIYNPMVVFIGIESYFEEYCNEFVCTDLKGIDRDYENIKRLCKLYKYDLYPKKLKLTWTQKELISFIKERANDIGHENNKIYDSIFLIISCHGYKNAIITSDYEHIDKTAIHRLFSTNYPSVRVIPRIYMFDCCSGDQQRSTHVAGFAHNDESDNEEKSKQITVKDKGKHFITDDIEINQYNDEIWKKDQQNPDFKVSLIHAANEGFQSKMNSIDGSYLVYQFVKRMIDNFKKDKEKELYFGEIIDDIQQYLHGEGKQQIKATYNNFSRYLKFRSNRCNGTITNDSEPQEIEMT